MTSSEDDPDEFVVGAKYAYVLDRAGAKVHLEYIEYAQPNLARLGEWLYWTKVCVNPSACIDAPRASQNPYTSRPHSPYH